MILDVLDSHVNICLDLTQASDYDVILYCTQQEASQQANSRYCREELKYV